jgi:hypothetical protein
VWVLFPRRFVFAVRGGMLLTQTDLLGIEDVAEAYRAAISWIEPHLDRNQYKLARISGWFNVACVLLVAEVVVWTLSLTS